jgi:hypothetical protein
MSIFELNNVLLYEICHRTLQTCTIFTALQQIHITWYTPVTTHHKIQADAHKFTMSHVRCDVAVSHYCPPRLNRLLPLDNVREPTPMATDSNKRLPAGERNARAFSSLQRDHLFQKAGEDTLFTAHYTFITVKCTEIHRRSMNDPTL